MPQNEQKETKEHPKTLIFVGQGKYNTQMSNYVTTFVS